MKNNFLDALDGSWDNAIENTYKESTMENLLEFPLLRKNSSFFNVFMSKTLSPQHEGERVLDIIIPENTNVNFDIAKADTSFSYIYYINYNNVPLREVTFRLENGVEIKPSTPETMDKEVSFCVMIIETKDPNENSANTSTEDLSYKISMCEEPEYDLFAVQNATKHVFVPRNLIDLTSDYNQQPNFGIIIKRELKNKGLNL